MIIIKTASELRNYCNSQRSETSSLGFVPTMGALHEGHLELIRTARENSPLVVCSIFVNPTQFNNAEDFRLYPKTVSEDIERLIRADCDILFLPDHREIYPPEHIKKDYDLGKLEQIFEGAHRPGHFQGVCEVVERLLDLVNPDQLYLGRKDYQQCLVIKRLIEILGKEDRIEMILVPTVREADGLAMSSRNRRLSDSERAKAPQLFSVLSHVKNSYNKTDFSDLELEASAMLEKDFRIDYLKIVDKEDLTPTREDQKKNLVVLVAAHLGDIRLIDNIELS